MVKGLNSTHQGSENGNHIVLTQIHRPQKITTELPFSINFYPMLSLNCSKQFLDSPLCGLGFLNLLPSECISAAKVSDSEDNEDMVIPQSLVEQFTRMTFLIPLCSQQNTICGLGNGERRVTRFLKS